MPGFQIQFGAIRLKGSFTLSASILLWRLQNLEEEHGGHQAQQMSLYAKAKGSVDHLTLHD